MSGKAKLYDVDYDVSEILERSGINAGKSKRQAMHNYLKNLENRYGLNTTEFKVDHETNSSYMFPPEVAELLIILIKNYKNHPQKQCNTNIKNVSAKNVSLFYNGIRDDIENIPYEALKNILYCEDSHYPLYVLCDWINPLISEFSKLITIMLLSSRQDMGTFFEKTHDIIKDTNSNLLKGNNNLKLLDISPCNISFDIVIVDLINKFLEIEHQYRDSNGSKIEEFKKTNKYLSKNNKDINKLRNEYIKRLFYDDTTESTVATKRKNIEDYQKVKQGLYKWNNIPKLKEGFEREIRIRKDVLLILNDMLYDMKSLTNWNLDKNIEYNNRVKNISDPDNPTFAYMFFTLLSPDLSMYERVINTIHAINTCKAEIKYFESILKNEYNNTEIIKEEQCSLPLLDDLIDHFVGTSLWMYTTEQYINKYQT